MPEQLTSITLLMNFSVFLGAYLIGSFSTAIITCRLMGLQDPRTIGSGNPGATNVLRFGGKKAASITLLGDALKGLIPVLLAKGLTIFLAMDSFLPIACAGFGAFLGHLYPVFFRFRGGKGVATALGILLIFSWKAFLLAGATWLMMAMLFRYSALAALTAFAVSPLYLSLFATSHLSPITMTAITLLIFWRHRSNINKLIHGQESKIGDRA